MILYFCDGPGCVAHAHPKGVHARATGIALERHRERPEGEAPVVYLPPAGWDQVLRKDGTRRQVCSAACRDALLGLEGGVRDRTDAEDDVLDALYWLLTPEETAWLNSRAPAPDETKP